jgi:prepilin-type N-terminal cleavage/methylation domain-containing protein
VGQRPHAIRRTDSGFTLTELLIVIVILGVLTGIVVFAVGAFTNRGEVSACRTAMKTTEVAIEAYRASNDGKVPQTLTPDLQPAYLRTDPSTAKYTISWDLGTGQVKGVLAKALPPASGTGADTTDCLAAKP